MTALARSPTLRALVIVAVAVMAVGCASLDSRARQLMYRPTAARPEPLPTLRPGDEQTLVEVAGHDGTTEHVALWWLPNADRAAPTLLYLHGTFRNLYRNHPKMEALRDAGFSVLAVDYRGFGDSTPIVPSQRSILADADVAWAELVRRQPDPCKRVIYGHSLGGAVAIDLASRKHVHVDYGALAVESTFSSLVDLAGSAVGPLGPIAVWLSSERFDSLAAIAKVDAPILMLHGDRDDTVPIALGRKLRDAAPPGTRWIEIPNGSHSRLHENAPAAYRAAFESLIASLCSQRSAGARPGTAACRRCRP
ncbi:MAG TPA: alpha/beta hydrolase [Caldimonas sp.]|nr:alpha/beta hydrolase [Caldimonas sp.]